MKVQKIEIVNFKGIAGLSKELNGSSVYVIGKNAGGKTSFIDAVFVALTGKDMPDEPIKKGQKEAKIEVDLGGGSGVIVDFKRVKDKVTQKLTLVQDGEVVTETPRARLNAMIGTIDFDPFEFMSKSPKEKLDYFLKIAGINTNDIDSEYKENLELINLENKELKKIDLLPYDEKLAALEEKPVAQVMKELDDAKAKNKPIEDFEIKLGGMVQRGLDIQAEQERLAAELVTINENIIKGQQWLEKQKKIPLEPFRDELDKLDENNKKIREAKEAKAGNDKREKLQNNIELATERNKELRKEKESLVNTALEGIPGVTFEDDQFFLDGLPFEPNQGNTAAQIIAGLGIGVKMLGEVRIARFEGSLLDDEHLSSVEKWAQENDLQLFIELVDRSGEGLKIEIIES